MKIENLSAVEVVKREYGLMKILSGVKSTVMKSNNLDLKMLDIDPHSSTSKHYHKNSESVFYFIDGSAKLEIQDNLYKMEKGDIALVEPFETHQIKNDSNNLCVVIEVMAPGYTKDDIFYVE